MKKTPIFLFYCFLFPIFLLAQESSTLQNIKNSNLLKVCIWTEYYGISYLDERTQQLKGIDSDLAVELAKDLKVELEFVSSSFVTFIEDLTQHKCDIAMFAIGDTPERKKHVRFTTPHLQSDIYAIASKLNPRIKKWEDIDQKGVVVSVAKGTYHEPVMQEKLQHATLFIAKNMQKRQLEVEAGRADVFMTDFPFAKRMLEKTLWAKLITPSSTYHLTPYAWAITYGDDEFYTQIEAFILRIKKDGRLLKAAKNNGLEPIVQLN